MRDALLWCIRINFLGGWWGGACIHGGRKWICDRRSVLKRKKNCVMGERCCDKWENVWREVDLRQIAWQVTFSGMGNGITNVWWAGFCDGRKIAWHANVCVSTPNATDNYHFAFLVESYGDPLTLCAQLKTDVIIIFTGFECHKIVAVIAGWTDCGLGIAVLCFSAIRLRELS